LFERVAFFSKHGYICSIDSWVVGLQTLFLVPVIYSELARYPRRTLGCLGFYEPNNSSLRAETWDPIRDTFGWKDNRTGFDRKVESLFQPPPPLDQSEKDQLVKYTHYMQAMVQVHDSVVELCRRQVMENKQQIS